jgi:hypothetical protein
MLLRLILTLLPIPPLLAAMVSAAFALVDQCKRKSTPFLALTRVSSCPQGASDACLPAGLQHVYRLAVMEGCAYSFPTEERV